MSEDEKAARARVLKLVLEAGGKELSADHLTNRLFKDLDPDASEIAFKHLLGKYRGETPQHFNPLRPSDAALPNLKSKNPALRLEAANAEIARTREAERRELEKGERIKLSKWESSLPLAQRLGLIEDKTAAARAKAKVKP